MTIKVGINGFGRIGRNFFRAAKERGADIDFVAANDLLSVELMAHLLKYDTILGTYDGDVELVGDGIRVNPGLSGILIQGNRIGTNVLGSVALPNGGIGIRGSGGLTIGGTTPSARNQISGNGGAGVDVLGGVVVQGNWIGPHVSGVSGLPNSQRFQSVSSLRRAATSGSFGSCQRGPLSFHTCSIFVI